MKLSHTITCALAAVAVCACLPSGAAAAEASEDAAAPVAADPALTEEIAFIEAYLREQGNSFADPVRQALYPQVVWTLARRAARAAAENGKFCGSCAGPSKDSCLELMGRGVQWMTIAQDVRIISASLAKAVRDING